MELRCDCLAKGIRGRDLQLQRAHVCIRGDAAEHPIGAELQPGGQGLMACRLHRSDAQIGSGVIDIAETAAQIPAAEAALLHGLQIRSIGQARGIVHRREPHLHRGELGGLHHAGSPHAEGLHLKAHRPELIRRPLPMHRLPLAVGQTQAGGAFTTGVAVEGDRLAARLQLHQAGPLRQAGNFQFERLAGAATARGSGDYTAKLAEQGDQLILQTLKLTANIQQWHPHHGIRRHGERGAAALQGAGAVAGARGEGEHEILPQLAEIEAEVGQLRLRNQPAAIRQLRS